MKKTITLTLASVITLTFMSFDILNDDGRAGATGSPNEPACNAASCHTTNPLNSGGGSVTISSPTLGNTYTPGQTYTINVTVAKTGINLFGFAMEALTSTGTNAGNLVITNSAQTILKSATVVGQSRKSVVHKLNAGATSNSHVFTFNWTAPATNIGNVTFYAAGNAANGNGFSSGDFIYTTSQVITPAIVSGIAENNTTDFQFSAFPNPTTDKINVSYSLTENATVSAQLISLNGKVISTFFKEQQNAGKNEMVLTIDPSVARGLYLLALNVNGNRTLKKIIVK